MSNVIEIRNLSFSYDYEEENKTLVLDDVTLDIERGSYTVIVGHNGSGKSTLAKLMIGLLEKEKGNIYIDGLELNRDTIYDIRNKIGVVFQNPDNQFIGATVEDDIAFGLENHLVPNNEMQPIIEEYANKTGMLEFLDKEPTKLSGGQKQRVAIAGVLAMRPEIIILDEATSMLDPKGKREIKELIKKMRDIVPNITIVSITHDISEAVASDKVVVMNKGKVFATGTPKEIFSDEDKLKEVGLQLPFTYKVQHELQKEGYSLELVMSTKEMVKEICQLNSEK
jgi:energy-coupling factor transport system ATP-binding protein